MMAYQYYCTTVIKFINIILVKKVVQRSRCFKNIIEDRPSNYHPLMVHQTVYFRFSAYGYLFA